MAGAAPPTLTDGEIEAIVDRYRDAMIRYEEAAIAVEARLRRELRATGVRALLSSRAKHPDEVRSKLLRKRSASSPPSFIELTRSLNAVLTDLAGARVIVYHAAEEAQVFAMLQTNLSIVPGSADVKRSTTTPYRASHLLIEIDESFYRESIRGTIVEIQVASIASHVLNEVEHDIAYKDHGVPATASVKESLTEVFHATRLLDAILVRLLDARSASVEARQAFIASPEELRHWLERQAARALNGDFFRLFRLLDAAVSQLTAAALEQFGHPAVLIEAGRGFGRRDQNKDVDDATAYALGLMPELGAPFRQQASRWRGPSTDLKRAILGSRAS